MGNGNPNISSDYLAILGASTSDLGIESAHFCGVFDGFNNIFPGVKSKVFFFKIDFSKIKCWENKLFKNPFFSCISRSYHDKCTYRLYT